MKIEISETKLALVETSYGYRLFRGPYTVGNVVRTTDPLGDLRLVVSIVPSDAHAMIVDSFRDLRTVCDYLRVNAGYIEGGR